MQFLHKEGKVLKYVILILVAYVTNKKRRHIDVEYFIEHTKVTPYRSLSRILQNKKICHIAS